MFLINAAFGPLTRVLLRIIKQTFTVMEVRRRGAEWARMNPGFTRDQLEARRAQFSEAWGDGLAQQFYFGAVDEVW